MRNIVPILLTGFFSMMALAIVGMSGYWVTYEEAPPQPIDFPHFKHAGNLGLECTTCHLYVEKSKHATVPPMSVCMDCHENAAIAGPEIEKLKKYWADKEPVPWVRIHELPQHVYFSHKRHIKADVECESCHGDMQVVRTVKQVRSFQMGFCISCHRQNNASIDCATCHK